MHIRLPGLIAITAVAAVAAIGFTVSPSCDIPPVSPESESSGAASEAEPPPAENDLPLPWSDGQVQPTLACTYWQNNWCCKGSGQYGWDCPDGQWINCTMSGSGVSSCIDNFDNEWNELIGPDGETPKVLNVLKHYMQPYRPWSMREDGTQP